jgi:ketosteroid isomerase-like protein
MVWLIDWWFSDLNAEQILRRTETVLHTQNGRVRREERWRWLLYVALAIVGGLLTFVGARAQQKATDEATFRKLIDSYCAAWSTGNADNPAHFYAQEDGLVFYDVTPFAYHSWKEYHDGVKKELFDNMESGTLSAGKDLKVRRHGTVAWTTVSMHFSEKTKDGKNLETEIRYTGIWEHRPAGWVIVHEHLSAPLGGS